jgi:hypothetical protein
MGEDIKVSDWNEANLKMLRLHDIQNRINFYKRDPKGFVEGKFNYESWAREIEVLFGEGEAKYAPSERKEMVEVRDAVRKLLRFSSPHLRIVSDGFGSKRNGFIIDDDKYFAVVEAVEKFESRVKELNDKHGLSTKNKGSAGLF